MTINDVAVLENDLASIKKMLEHYHMPQKSHYKDTCCRARILTHYYPTLQTIQMSMNWGKDRQINAVLLHSTNTMYSQKMKYCLEHCDK